MEIIYLRNYRLRCNNVLYDRPEKRKPKQRGRNKKYGQRLGAATDMAKTVPQKARSYTVNLYGKQREVRAYSRSGSRYFCESLFWASQPKQAAKT
ncbi:hypothetical protein [Bathymodiolus japonicus methanotrophic gill symbiont]|uniref:hypothetical protein n=1 Tax=Bathymodiolus japonicus methanotrophic gill symbiont TaxID=113269 RepID=UPI001C8ED9E7|nr:hypothetical protein [Bathymodiolus japonicus methanotrophic gill symbiont]